MKPMHFADGAAFRAWLEQHHAHAEELELAFYRQGSGRGGITYAEALDEALCFGWIDGLRKKLDANRYTIRFTPRRPRSIWSLVNVRHAQRLVRTGRMREAGAKAFAARTKDRTATYSFENRPEQLPQSLARRFRADAGAWKFFGAQPPGYRRTLIWWVISAKQAATQLRRLERVISVSAGRDRVDLAAPFGSKPNQNP